MNDNGTRSKHALLIGINEYANLSEKSQLKGCVNDARLMESVLVEQFGFDRQNIRMLTDEQATREGILAGLEDLTNRVAEDDIAVVFYAGHGSEIKDLEGDELDGYDSTLVPHDAVRPPKDAENPPPNVDITDDEIHVWLQDICAKTGNVTLIFDCCHSGTIARDDLGYQARQIDSDERSAETIGRVPLSIATRGSAPEGGSGWLPISDRYVLIAGCRDVQTAKEYKPNGVEEKQGAMTYFLCEELRRAEPGTTYRDVFERARARVIGRIPDQHPQMEGAGDREIFGIHDIKPMRYLLVSERSGSSVSIEGGSMQFVLVGSEWTIYPSGTKSESDTPVGRIRVEEISATKSKGIILEESSEGAIVSGCRATVEDGAAGLQPLKILVAGNTDFEGAVAELRAEFMESGLLELVDEGDAFDLCIFAIDRRADDGTEKAPVSHLKVLDAPSWVTVDPTGRIALPIHTIEPKRTVETMRANAEKVAKYRRVLDLSPGADDPLRGKIEATFLRKDATGEWLETRPDAEDGTISFVDGDPIQLRITNHHSEHLHIYVLSLSMVYEIESWFPDPPGAEEILKPGRTSPGIRTRYLWSIDDGFPFGPDPADPEGMSGTDVIKIIASVEPVDLRSLSQEGVRDDLERRHSSSALSDLIESVGSGVRGSKRAGPIETWTSINIPVRIDPATSTRSIDPEGVTDLGPVVIRSKGISGDAELLPVMRERTRSLEGKSDFLSDTLAEENVYAQHVLKISNHVAERGLEESSLEIDVRDPGSEQGQFALYIDEAGVMSWHFPETEGASRSAERGSAIRTYRIDRNAATEEALGSAARGVRLGLAQGASEGTRGLISANAMKLIEVLAFPLVDPVLGAVSDYFAGNWEAKRRAYGLRTFTPGNRSNHDGDPVSDWSSLSTGRSLLLVHGALSRSNRAFAGFSDETLRELHKLYEGRVFAFDHHTLTKDPKKNVGWLLNHIPDDTHLDLDVICHGRGGLVSRALTEKLSEFSLGSKSLKVNKVVFAGSPNSGTGLAKIGKAGELINSFTNLLNFIPDNPAGAVLDALVTVAKVVSVGVSRGLEGLHCMAPDGDFQKWLNAGGGVDGVAYYALSSDYRPRTKGLAEYGRSLVMRKIFDGDNDLIVPTDSVFKDNGSPLFPIESPYVAGPEEDVSHIGYFSNQMVQERILGWLGRAT